MIRRGWAGLVAPVAVVGSVLLYAVVARAQPTTPDQAVQDARSVPRPDPRSILTPGNASVTVPQYGADVSGQSGLYAGGNGVLVPPGLTRVSDCMAAGDPECIAVQLVATGRTTRPPFTISPSDPLITGAVTIVRDPTAVVGSTPGGLSPGFQTCTTTNRTTPATYVDETCDIVTVDSENTCLVTRDIQVDVDANYRCQVSPNQAQSFYCNKTLQVDVVTGPPTCSPNTWVVVFPRTSNAFWSPGVYKLIHYEAGYYCEIDRGDGMLQITFGAGTDAEIAGEWRTATIRIDPAQPVSPGAMPVHLGTLTIKYGIPVDVYYSTVGNPATAADWSVRLYYFVLLWPDRPPFAPTGVSCPSGGVDGTRVRLYDSWSDSYSIPGDPWLCYVEGTGGGSALVDWTYFWASVGTYPATYTGWTMRSTDMTVVDMTFKRPTYTVLITDSWVNGCTALEARQ